MADITNQQLFESLIKAINRVVKQALADYPTKTDLNKELSSYPTKDDMHAMEQRLTRKLDSYKQANIQHHLATRQEVGELNRKFDHLREGLALAANG